MTLPTQQYKHIIGEIVQAGVVHRYMDKIPTAVEGVTQLAYTGDYVVIHSDGECEVYPPELLRALYQKL